MKLTENNSKKNPTNGKNLKAKDSKLSDENPPERNVTLAWTQQQNLLWFSSEALAPVSAAGKTRLWFDWMHLDLPLIKEEASQFWMLNWDSRLLFAIVKKSKPPSPDSHIQIIPETLNIPRLKLPPRSVRTSLTRGWIIGDNGIIGKYPSPLPPLLASKWLGNITWEIRNVSKITNRSPFFVPTY